jgi:hypothetical protein
MPPPGGPSGRPGLMWDAWWFTAPSPTRPRRRSALHAPVFGNGDRGGGAAVGQACPHSPAPDRMPTGAHHGDGHRESEGSVPANEAQRSASAASPVFVRRRRYDRPADRHSGDTGRVPKGRSHRARVCRIAPEQCTAPLGVSTCPAAHGLGPAFVPEPANVCAAAGGDRRSDPRHLDGGVERPGASHTVDHQLGGIRGSARNRVLQYRLRDMQP